jgi:hypothetical protein
MSVDVACWLNGLHPEIPAAAPRLASSTAIGRPRLGHELRADRATLADDSLITVLTPGLVWCQRMLVPSLIVIRTVL